MKNEETRSITIMTQSESHFFTQVKKIIGLLSLVMMIFTGLTQKSFACGSPSGGGYPAPVIKKR